MDPLKILLFGLVLFSAHTIETVLGFGSSLIALTLGVYVFPLNTILPVIVFMGLLQSIWLVARWFRHIQWGVLLAKILPAAFLGMVIGIYYRTQVADYRQLVILLGIFIMAASLLEIVLIYKTRTAGGSLPWYLGIPLLVIGGVFHGIFAAGGPMIVYYASREIKEPAQFKGTISTLWLILNLLLLGNLHAAGQINLETLGLSALVLPALAGGIWMGSRLKFRTIVFKVLIYALLFVAGLLLLFQQ